MSLAGMNLAEVRSIATRLRREADSLQQCSRAVERLVQQAGQSWNGPDLDEFRSRWQRELRSTAERAAADVRALAETLVRNADEQERISHDLEAAGGPTGPTGTPPEDPPGTTPDGPPLAPGPDWSDNDHGVSKPPPGVDLPEWSSTRPHSYENSSTVDDA